MANISENFIQVNLKKPSTNNSWNEYIPHYYINSQWKTCNAFYYFPFFIFTLNQDAISYSVTINMQNPEINNVTSLTIPSNYNNKPVTRMYGFNNLINLQTLNIPSSIQTIEAGALNGCGNLVNLTIPFVGHTTADSENMFGYIFGDVSYTGGSSITQYKGIYPYKNITYYIPSSLRKVYVLGGNITQYAFSNCTMLTEIHISDTVLDSPFHAFYGCSNLEEVTIPFLRTNPHRDGSTGELTCQGYPFGGFFEEKAYTSKAGYTIINQEYNEYPNSGTISTVEAYIPNTLTKVNITGTAIPNGAFDDCKTLREIVIDDSVDFIGKSAFKDCINLQIVTMPYEMSDVTYGSIGPHAFDNCSLLLDIVIPHGVTRIPSLCFYNNSSLRRITMTDNTSIGRRAFEYCYDLREITFSQGLTTISQQSFADCGESDVGYRLELTLPNSVTYISEQAFLRSNIKSITLSSGLTSLNYSVFERCSLLESVVIPDTITSFGNSLFYECANLSDIYYTGTQEQWNAITKVSTWDYHAGPYTIHYNYSGGN